MPTPYTLAILDPGHFHAALPLRRRHPSLASEVLVFAPEGPDVRRFLAMIERFNGRGDDPTAWRLEWHRSDDPVRDLLADRRAQVAVLAGRNRGKMQRIRALVEAGVHVLADKPWVVEPEDLADLDAIAEAPAHWRDMMTERHEPWARLFDSLAADAAVTGDPDAMRGPALELSTVHHLAKMVDGVPLVRPAWYFDTRQQGEGIIDVTTHLVDRVQRLSWARAPSGMGPIRLLRASRWPTPVPAAEYQAITGTALATDPAVHAAAGVLPLMANGELTFAAGGIVARVRAEWRLRSSRGDAHAAIFRGTRADMTLTGDAGGNRLLVAPHGDCREVLARICGLPGVRAGEAADGIEVEPDERSGHEEHFATVLDGFLAAIPRPPDQGERRLTYERYRLLAQALSAARG